MSCFVLIGSSPSLANPKKLRLRDSLKCTIKRIINDFTVAFVGRIFFYFSYIITWQTLVFDFRVILWRIFHVIKYSKKREKFKLCREMFCFNLTNHSVTIEIVTLFLCFLFHALFYCLQMHQPQLRHHSQLEQVT